MDDSLKVYITSDYSIELDKDDIVSIASNVYEDLYAMPRPADYSVADILGKVDFYAGVLIEQCMNAETDKGYCLSDLDNKQLTKSDYWQVIKKVLEKIDVIVK